MLDTDDIESEAYGLACDYWRETHPDDDEGAQDYADEAWRLFEVEAMDRLEREQGRGLAVGVERYAEPGRDPYEEHRPFVHAAVSAPDDEAPWHIWADKLSETGHGHLSGLVRHTINYHRHSLSRMAALDRNDNQGYLDANDRAHLEHRAIIGHSLGMSPEEEQIANNAWDANALHAHGLGDAERMRHRASLAHAVAVRMGDVGWWKDHPPDFGVEIPQPYARGEPTRYEFDPGRHPRDADDGRFVEVGGHSRVRQWAAQSARLPGHLKQRAQEAGVKLFRKFESRYGRKAAVAMIAASGALLPVPVPGLSLFGPIAVAEAVLAVRRMLKGKEAEDFDLALEAVQYAAGEAPPAEPPPEGGPQTVVPPLVSHVVEIDPGALKPRDRAKLAVLGRPHLEGLHRVPAGQKLPDELYPHAKPLFATGPPPGKKKPPVLGRAPEGGHLVHPMAGQAREASSAPAIREHVDAHRPVSEARGGMRHDVLRQPQAGVILSHADLETSSVPLLDQALPAVRKSNLAGVVHYLHGRSRDALGGPLDWRNPEHQDAVRRHLAHMIGAEAEVALRRPGENAISWYKRSIREMQELAKLAYPELRDNEDLHDILNLALAVTSNGTRPKVQMPLAMEAFEHYRDHGVFPTAVGKGPTGHEMNIAFGKLNNLQEQQGGMRGMLDFLNRQMSVREIREWGHDVSGEDENAPTYGSAIIGPKIGNGFYQNLKGRWDQLTMDRWWMRTIGRLRGALMDDDYESVQRSHERFLRSMYDPATARQPVVAHLLADPERFGYTLRDVFRDPMAAHDLAYRIFRNFANGKYKEKGEPPRAAKSLVEALNGPKDDPRGPADRNFMRSLVPGAMEYLRQHGRTGIEPAALQALLWFPEQDLYGKLGSTDPPEERDYASAMAAQLRNRDIPEAEIQAALRRARR